MESVRTGGSGQDSTLPSCAVNLIIRPGDSEQDSTLPPGAVNCIQSGPGIQGRTGQAAVLDGSDTQRNPGRSSEL